MINIDEINLAISNIDFWGDAGNCEGNKGGMRIYWSSDIGFGTFDIVKYSGADGESTDPTKEEFRIIGFSECMDTTDEKKFTKKILGLLAKKIDLVE